LTIRRQEERRLDGALIRVVSEIRGHLRLKCCPKRKSSGGKSSVNAIFAGSNGSLRAWETTFLISDMGARSDGEDTTIAIVRHWDNHLLIGADYGH
jgi:hypothetical protein